MTEKSTALPAPAPEVDDALGRLREFGLQQSWQVAFLLPHRWEDFLRPSRSCADWQSGTTVTLQGLVCEKPSVDFRHKPPRSVLRVSLSSEDVVRTMLFGDMEKVTGKLRTGDELLITGEAKQFNGIWWIGKPCIAPTAWVGRLRPIYPGKPGRISADQVRTRILPLLRDAIPAAVRWIEERLSPDESSAALLKRINAPTFDLAELIRWAHLPPSLAAGVRAQAALEAVAAADLLRSVEAHRHRDPAHRLLQLPTLRSRAMQIPFRLSPSQCTAISEVAEHLRGPDILRHTISGEVASGKTACYGVLAAAVVDELVATGEDGCVVVMLPNQNLATQIATEFATWWPDISLALVTAETKPDLTRTRLIVGTTAILNRATPVAALVIVDEQHKLSIKQREALVTSQTHSIDVSATCIPRTTALVRYGAMGITRLEKGHTDRTIKTTLWEPDDVRPVYAGVRDTVQQGDNVLVIYPSIDENERNKLSTSIRTSLGRWESQFPGKVRSIHSQCDPVAQALALRDVATGKAQILISSTIIEVGVNIPRLRRVVVIHPDRFSANVLHQIRGRLAREGGEGDFDLLPLNELKDETKERLQILVQHADGFSVAEADLEQRGFGDLSIGSDKQSGQNESFLIGRSVKPSAIAQLIA